VLRAADLVLIGLRASGKSALGRLVATRRERPFVDLDLTVAARAGAATPGEALRRSGLASFRLLEAEAVAELLDPHREQPRRPAVLALGGGAPTAPGVHDRLLEARSDGRVFIVLLEAPVRVLAERIGVDPSDRPPLTDLPLEQELEHLASMRIDDYRRLAQASLSTDALTLEQAALALERLWCDSGGAD